MIPQRIRLQGFLCYKDEQEVRFDGASLWVLSGLNGSGKSTVFDAVTYALFGYHRGGSQQAQELINKDSDGLLVEFDFLLDGQAYRAKRTVRRNARGSTTSTQQILRRKADQTSWVPVEGTGQKKEFEAWVRDHIGLTYETFTSSVLLLQGKAEKLLDASPKGRFEVLASIVDLERYERLHARADVERRELKDEHARLKTQIEQLPEVTEAQWTNAESRIQAAEITRQQAEAEVERLHALEIQAHRWVEARSRLAAIRLRWEQARKLLDQSADIERDVKQLRELRAVLPPLKEVVGQRSQVHAADERIKQLEAHKERLATQLSQQDHALEQFRQKRVVLQNHLATGEARLRDVSERLRNATELVTRVKEHEQHEADLARLQAELKRFTEDPAAAVARTRDRCDHLDALGHAVRVLDRIRLRRDELRHTVPEAEKAHRKVEEITRRGERLSGEVKKLQPLAEESSRARQQADQRAAEARALLLQDEQALQEFQRLEGAGTCRQCGQPLTKAHFQEELRRRVESVQTRTAHFQQATVDQQKAQRSEQELKEHLARLEKERQDAREEYREQKARADQGHRQVERLILELNQSYGEELPVPFRENVAPSLPRDWLATTYPTLLEVESARREAGGLPETRRRLREQETALQEWRNLKAKEETIRESIARLAKELPGDRQSVRQTHSRLETEQQALEKTLAAHRAELQDVQKELDRFTREREGTQRQLADTAGSIKSEETSRTHCRQAVSRATKELPPAWHEAAEKAGSAEIFTWEGELKDLVDRKVDELGESLQQARQGVELLHQDMEALQKAEQDFPENARQEPAVIQAAFTQAKRQRQACEDELNQARNERSLLETRRNERAKLNQSIVFLQAEHQHFETLTKLLSRDRLQLHRVRTAERQVVDHANAVLDRLSGGQLLLRLCGEADGDSTATKALQLEAYNRQTGERPINVAFLSGSQKFRVAVSLALGIGQYASRQHRPIESVIIDEGFGCLDQRGRQVMIQELHNLRGHLHCILLVSHQEEFADAFADGYHFELDGGSTRVKRIQK